MVFPFLVFEIFISLSLFFYSSSLNESEKNIISNEGFGQCIFCC
jgi:hypothetical protein